MEMNMLQSGDIGWGEKLAVISHYKLTDDQATLGFGVTIDELTTAKMMAAKGVFTAPKSIDFGAYKDEIFALLNHKVHDVEVVKEYVADVPAITGIEVIEVIDVEESITAKPVTATKPVKVPKKRGRKGDKIVIAFRSVPTEPTDAEAFASQYNVSMNVLRQAKRFDSTGIEGSVKVKRDKELSRLMIWRETV